MRIAYTFATIVGLLATGSAFGDVRGLYGTECLEMKDLSATKDLLFDVAEHRMEIVHTVYADKTCSRPAYDFSFSGPYQFDEDTGHLEYTFASIQLRVLDENVATAFIEHGLCGFQDWALDTAREVTGLNCAGTRMPDAGLKLYDVMKESPEGVQLGLADAEKDGLHEDRRPVGFDPHIYAPR